MKRPLPILLINGAGCRNRTCFVSLKRRVHSHICQSRTSWFFSSSRSRPFPMQPVLTSNNCENERKREPYWLPCSFRAYAPETSSTQVGASHSVRGKLRKPIPQ